MPFKTSQRTIWAMKTAADVTQGKNSIQPRLGKAIHYLAAEKLNLPVVCKARKEREIHFCASRTESTVDSWCKRGPWTKTSNKGALSSLFSQPNVEDIQRLAVHFSTPLPKKKKKQPMQQNKQSELFPNGTSYFRLCSVLPSVPDRQLSLFMS